MEHRGTGHVAFITGASGGIGYATALEFARRGTHVGTLARRVERLTELERAVQALPQPHGDLLALAGDVRDADAVRAAVDQVAERFGRLDVLVANAGVGHRGAITDADWADLDLLLRTNIDGVLHSVRAVVPHMRRGGGGHIVIVSSVVATAITPYTAAYSASKAFISSLARSLQLELEKDGIAVTDLRLGRTATEFNQRRLGVAGYAVRAPRLPTMPVERVAAAIVRFSEGRGGTKTVRLFDRLILLGNMLVPQIIGRLALRQYRT